MILCGCEGERQSNFAEVIEAKDVLVQKQCDGCRTHVLDEDGDHHGVSGVDVQVGDERLLLGSGDEICEAYQDPGNGEEFGEICLVVRVIFCWVMDESWGSSKCDHEKLVLSEADDHGLESGLEFDDGVLHAPGVHGGELWFVHGCVKVEMKVL